MKFKDYIVSLKYMLEVLQSMHPKDYYVYSYLLRYIRFTGWYYTPNVFRDFIKAYAINRMYMFALGGISNNEIMKIIRECDKYDSNFYEDGRFSGYVSFIAYGSDKTCTIDYTHNQRPCRYNTFYRNNLLEVL